MVKIKYFVRTTGERTLDKSFSQIEYELLVDKEHRPVKSFIEQLEYLGSLDCDVVLLEDDIILCKDFKNRIEEVISKYPNDIINFFTNPKGYFLTQKVLGKFSFNQCTYYPKGITKSIVPIIKKIPNWENIGYDLLVNKALIQLNLSHIQYRPCLIQHIDYNSLLPFTHYSYRRTPYFIDYLNELGISYDEAKYLENEKKLSTLMKEKFKSINNKKD